jgi:hypothetical protein
MDSYLTGTQGTDGLQLVSARRLMNSYITVPREVMDTYLARIQESSGLLPHQQPGE